MAIPPCRAAVCLDADAVLGDSDAPLGDVFVDGNSAAQDGGGIKASAALSIVRGTISGNSQRKLERRGLNILSGAGAIDLREVAIDANRALDGGGVWLTRSGGSVVLERVSISGNSVIPDGSQNQ